jgi:hypothetical protein
VHTHLRCAVQSQNGNMTLTRGVPPGYGPRMSDGLDDRRKALEDEFFYKEDQKKLHNMKDKLDAQQGREDLKKVSGMSDDAVLDRLVALGLRANTVAALSLVPLIAVAWADGVIQDNEREAILQGAHGKGLEKGTPGHDLLISWLSKKPDDSLFDAWAGYIRALSAQLTDEKVRLLKNQIVGFAKLVAGVAGGILGIAKVSGSEEKVLHKIEAAFTR